MVHKQLMGPAAPPCTAPPPQRHLAVISHVGHKDLGLLCTISPMTAHPPPKEVPWPLRLLPLAEPCTPISLMQPWPPAPPHYIEETQPWPPPPPQECVPRHLTCVPPDHRCIAHLTCRWSFRNCSESVAAGNALSRWPVAVPPPYGWWQCPAINWVAAPAITRLLLCPDHPMVPAAPTA